MGIVAIEVTDPEVSVVGLGFRTASPADELYGGIVPGRFGGAFALGIDAKAFDSHADALITGMKAFVEVIADAHEVGAVGIVVWVGGRSVW